MPVFFVDRSLGSHLFPDALAAAGLTIERHHDHFAHDADDEDWIRFAAANDWYALSQDDRIYRNPVQREIVMTAGLGYFVLTAANAKAVEVAANFVATYPAIERFIARTGRPFIASVQRSSVAGRPGRVALRWPR